MKNEIKLNNKVTADTKKFISTMTLLQASTGGGKSFAIRRIIEQSFNQVPHIILDTEGEFSTLREKYDFILIGKGMDIEPNPKTAKLMAHSLWRERVSAIIDLYELTPWERQEFVKNFVTAMVDSPKEIQKPIYLTIDEAHEYAPEGDKTESGRALHLLASKGRKRHIGVMYATQRISTLSKNVVAACKNKLIGYTSLDTDMKRASAELGFGKEQALSLRQLDPGEFYAFGPAISKDIIKFKIGPVSTSHGDEPETVSKVVPASDKVKKALAKLAELPHEAKKEIETIATLKEENRRLKISIEIDKREPKFLDKDQVEKVLKQGAQEAERSFAVECNIMQKEISSHKKVINGIFNLIKENEALMNHPLVMIKRDVITTAPYNPDKLMKDLTPKIPMTGFMVNVDLPTFSELKSVTGGALRILKVLVSRYPTILTKSQLATFAKLKPSSGTFSTYISLLKGNNYIQVEGNNFMATEDGIKFLGEVPNPPQSSDEVIQMWQNNLTGGSRRMFDWLVQNKEPVSKHELAEATGLVSSSGTFGTYLSILRSNGLIDVNGQTIKISDNLFI